MWIQQKFLETSSTYSVLVQCEARSEERIANLSNKITRNRSLPLPAIRIEKAVCMKTNEELYHKVYPSPRLPRVFVKPNAQSGQQDQPDQEARKSHDHQSVSGSHGETRSGNVDNSIPGMPHATVQQQDTNRKETVKILIQQFENHPNKESFLQDLNKTEKIKTLSEESKKLITDMGNTEILELCESSWHATLSRIRKFSVILNWPERIKTQPHDDRDNCFQHFDSKGPCGMTVNNDIDDDSATKHSDSHTRNSHRQSV